MTFMCYRVSSDEVQGPEGVVYGRSQLGGHGVSEEERDGWGLSPRGEGIIEAM